MPHTDADRRNDFGTTGTSKHGLARTTPPDFQRRNRRNACREIETSTHSPAERRAARKQAGESTHRPRTSGNLREP
ncbi:hypothetical protein NDU88_010574 [Pleurodeles waltl]|uniref:Uncharacterized protein n=1 Tax=Pleurodeles waltl TaxID=8319 RepID=A0AAV7S1M4_PLEWA|nr:hypothetical protein NDU88_010574 [Pleurodeles waltl]